MLDALGKLGFRLFVHLMRKSSTGSLVWVPHPIVCICSFTFSADPGSNGELASQNFALVH